MLGHRAQVSRPRLRLLDCLRERQQPLRPDSRGRSREQELPHWTQQSPDLERRAAPPKPKGARLIGAPEALPSQPPHRQPQAPCRQADPRRSANRACCSPRRRAPPRTVTGLLTPQQWLQAARRLLDFGRRRADLSETMSFVLDLKPDLGVGAVTRPPRDLAGSSGAGKTESRLVVRGISGYGEPHRSVSPARRRPTEPSRGGPGDSVVASKKCRADVDRRLGSSGCSEPGRRSGVARGCEVGDA